MKDRSDLIDMTKIKPVKVKWLVHGLLPTNGKTMVMAQSGYGKSTLARALARAVIRGESFLGRGVSTEAGRGIVLYLHLDAKDAIEDLRESFDQIGITDSEYCNNLNVLTQDGMPVKWNERREWLAKYLVRLHPDLLVIDTLGHFMQTEELNKYNEQIRAFEDLWTFLKKCGYQKHVMMLHHSGKDSDKRVDPFNAFIGSQAMRGSFNGKITLERDRDRGLYIIASDQHKREKHLGDLPPTVLLRDEETGELSLGSKISDLRREAAQSKKEVRNQDVLTFIHTGVGPTHEDIEVKFNMSSKTRFEVLKDLISQLDVTGTGHAGDPKRYWPKQEKVKPAHSTLTGPHLSEGAVDRRDAYAVPIHSSGRGAQLR